MSVHAATAASASRPEPGLPPGPRLPRVIQTADVHVRPDGVVFCTDHNAGLISAQYEG